MVRRYIHFLVKQESQNKYLYQIIWILIISLFELTQIETSAGGALPYIANHLSCKCHNDLNIYKNNEMKSIFVEVVNPKESNIIMWVIYRHLSMDLTDINCNYLKKY